MVLNVESYISPREGGRVEQFEGVRGQIVEVENTVLLLLSATALGCTPSSSQLITFKPLKMNSCGILYHI